MLSPKLVSLTVLACSGLALAQDTPYSQWAADSAISRGQGNGLNSGKPYVSYEHGEFWWGLRLLYEKTGDEKYYNYILDGASVLVDEDGSIIDQYRLATLY